MERTGHGLNRRGSMDERTWLHHRSRPLAVEGVAPGRQVAVHELGAIASVLALLVCSSFTEG